MTVTPNHPTAAPPSRKMWLIVLGTSALGLALAGYIYYGYLGNAIDFPLADKVMGCRYLDQNVCTFLKTADKAMAVKSVGTQQLQGETVIMTHINDAAGNAEDSITQQNHEIDHTISIGKNLYTKDVADNAWWSDKLDQDIKTPVPVASSGVNNLPNQPATGNGFPAFWRVGTEACGNLKCIKYQVGSSNDSKTFFWIDTTSHLLRKSQTKGPQSQSLVEFSYGDFKVSTPSPLKGPMPKASTDNPPSSDSPETDPSPEILDGTDLPGE